ncbi:MAG: hypothetical protein V3V00_16110, partial [Saprospiraceae bacterium]
MAQNVQKLFSYRPYVFDKTFTKTVSDATGVMTITPGQINHFVVNSIRMAVGGTKAGAGNGTIRITNVGTIQIGLLANAALAANESLQIPQLAQVGKSNVQDMGGRIEIYDSDLLRFELTVMAFGTSETFRVLGTLLVYGKDPTFAAAGGT